MAGKINPFPASEYALLGFLIPGPSYGYELHKKINEASGIGLIWGVKMSNLYAQLEKLEKKGYISGKLQPGELKPARKEFTLTSKGLSVINKWLHVTVDHPRDFRQEYMVKLFFLRQYQPETLKSFTEAQLVQSKKWLENTEAKKGALARKSTFEETVYQFRISQIQSMVNWLEWIMNESK